ncbi:hypothetical protein [Haloarcula marismortui]|uniref:Uncharacterized protein n=1 Tax=Haloarcula marismortui ATCC 33800 TaxID=662476 RepID=M0JCT9_9EURY|nr:hypothetical protein [Haloarcula sinaiiensis]EMA06173.1 hypothetical protein C436_21790 [Haloarcula sinaiiensis ATCC 33800]QUJ74770.1 hypothetical protein KDQ40_21845 [Haloarcula sinaiiensis ATCC 33800]
MVENTTTDSSVDRGGSSEEEPANPDGDVAGAEEESGELIDEISDSLADDGFGVFHGREFISLRENGQVAPNSTVSQQYLKGKEAVILAYNENTNEIAIIPLEQNYDRTNVYSLQWNDDRVSMSVGGFLKQNDIKPDQTMRYPPEWDEDIGNEHVPGGLLVDLDQEGEVSPVAHSGTDEDDEEVEA